jgi:hypothetical protein
MDVECGLKSRWKIHDRVQNFQLIGISGKGNRQEAAPSYRGIKSGALARAII